MRQLFDKSKTFLSEFLGKLNNRTKGVIVGALAIALAMILLIIGYSMSSNAVSGLTTNLADANNNIDSLRGQLDTANSRVEQLESDLNIIQSELEKALSDLNTAETNVSNLENENNALTADLELAHQENAKLQQEAADNAVSASVYSSGGGAENNSSNDGQESPSAVVWIPNSGSKYHSTSSCSNMKNPTQVTLDDAIIRGYGQCSKCW